LNEPLRPDSITDKEAKNKEKKWIDATFKYRLKESRGGKKCLD